MYLECGLDFFTAVAPVYISGVNEYLVENRDAYLVANTRRRVPRLSPFFVHRRLIISAEAAGPTSRFRAPPVYEGIPCVDNVSTPQT